MPGVFESNPLPRAINGSLWTLFYEVVCYGAVVASGLFGLLRRRLAFTGVFGLFAVLYVFLGGWEGSGMIAHRASALLMLGFPFALGMLAYLWRDRLKLDFRVAAVIWVLPILTQGTMFLLMSITVALGYSIICFGFLPKGGLLNYNRVGDYSYGTYLYAFPVKRAMAHLFPGATAVGNMLLAFPLRYRLQSCRGI